MYAQFAGTSLWFAGNAVLPALQSTHQFSNDSLGHITSAVQLGFIIGTLVYAILSLADRYVPNRVFFVSAVAGAFFNVAILLVDFTLTKLIIFRFLTGFFLAGIYPVGMKIAADWYEKGLGKALGFLVGALVLGTAFPHLLNSLDAVLSWQEVLLFVSVFAVSGGFLILLMPSGPYRRKAAKFKITAIADVFRVKPLLKSAIGYFGHMWELYAFWAFVPWFLAFYASRNQVNINVSAWSFAIIAIGSLSCVFGGLLSLKRGSYFVAKNSLTLSGLACLFSPLLFLLPFPLVIVYLLFWGATVIPDSPQFSSLVAASAPKEIIGTALTIVNCTGFTISVFSIQLFNYTSGIVGFEPYIFLLLLPGPLAGLWGIRGFVKN